MARIQVQGLHHITLVGSTRQSAIDFWQGLLGMRFIFEQPNLGRPDENHLYFDPGDGRLITVFTNETRTDEPSPHPRDIGHLEHIATAFAAGDFALPMFIHSTEPPGVATMKAKRAAMTFAYERLPRGGKVVVRTADPDALAALHDFLRFQIREHKTGDPLSPK